MSDDPFRHHPGLRDLITPRSDSRFADFRVDDARVLIEAQGLPTDWLLPETEREADRAATLKGRMDRDRWGFG
jgi:cation transport protein ChaC